VLTSRLILELVDGELSQPARNSRRRGAGLRGGEAVQEADMDLQLKMGSSDCGWMGSKRWSVWRRRVRTKV